MQIDKLKCQLKPVELQRPNNRVTLAVLKGFIPMRQELLRIIPSEVADWAESLSSIEVNEGCFGYHVKAVGKAVRAENDPDNPAFGERLAEARAKCRIYSFISKFCNRLLYYYNDILHLFPYSRNGDTYDSCGVVGNIRYYHALQQRETEHISNILDNEPD